VNTSSPPAGASVEAAASLDALIDAAWRARVHDLSEHEALARELAACAGSAPVPRGHAVTLEALRLVRQNHLDDAEALLDEADMLFESAHDGRGRCLVRDVRASSLMARGRFDAAMDTLAPNLALPAGARNAYDEFFTWGRASRAAGNLDRFEDALRYAYHMLSSAQRSGDAALLAQASGYVGGAHADWLNLEDAEPLCEQAYRLARGQRWHGVVIHVGWAIVLVLRHRHQEAIDVAQEIVALLAQQEAFVRWRASLFVAWVFAQAGEFENAQAWLERSTTLPAYPDEPPVEWVMTQARVWNGRGQHAQARRICDACVARHGIPAASGASTPRDLLQVHEELAEALEGLGEFRLALHSTREAVRLREHLASHATRSRRVALQVRFELATAQRERDEAHRREQVAETARLQLAALNAALDEANQAKTRFLAAASHDLRQPVHALTLQAAALRHELNTPRQIEMLSGIERCAGALSTMFDALLDLSRMDSGALQPHRQRVDVAALLLRLVEEHAPAAQARGLRLALRIGGGGRGATDSDAQLLESLLRNLIGNAIKYTERGAVLLCARRWRDPAGTPQWRLQVWDTGIGMAPQETQRVFDEFYQVGNPARRREQGLGLGLAIARRLARLLEHPLTLRSVLGRGSCFELRVPALPAPPEPERDALAPTSVGALHVVVIEDDPDGRTAMRDLLGQWGCRVTSGESADEVLAALARCPEPRAPDVLLADYRLPGPHTGAQEVARLREALARPLPALVLTGDLSKQTLAQLALKNLPWLPKPAPVLRLAAWLTSVARADGSG
jgi:signal transduction histidine kinase